LEMPVLAAFLADRGQWWREIAVDTVIRFGAQRALSDALVQTGFDIEELGAGEVDEGLARMAASALAAARSEELAEAGEEMAARGMVEMAAAEAMAEAGEELAAEGVVQVAGGAAALGAAAALNATSEMVEDVAE
jgi:hypothetical protein